MALGEGGRVYALRGWLQGGQSADIVANLDGSSVARTAWHQIDRARVQKFMIRCPGCGKRLRDGAPSCATHGVPPPVPPSTEEATKPFVVPNPDLPAYRVQKLLGQGGFGAVFLAERVFDGRLVAIKVARADNASAGDSLISEAEALSAVGEPHVPAMYESGRLPDGSVYVVMDFVKAPILADVMTALDGSMPIEDFARAALAILAVMEAAHGKKLVHCDLKPENVFVDPSFGAKLFDFGLVRRVGDRPAESTKEEAPAGTPEYMSPEQCEGRVDIDARSDLYALGVIFYEMLAGGPPFWGKPAEVQQNHRSRRPPALGRRVPLAVPLEEAIMRCLAKDPGRRFASATELRKALQAGLVAERARTEDVAAAPAIAAPEVTNMGVAKPSAPTAAKAAAPARERRAVALLFFETKSPVAAVREAMNSVGAQLANAAGLQYVLAFGHELGDNPTRAAANAGEMLIARGVCTHVLVDLAQVSLQARPDGSRRYTSPLFAKKEQYPAQSDPAGVLLSAAAVEVLPDAPADPVPERPGVMLLKKVTQAAERTTTRMSVSPLVGRDEVLRTLLDAARSAMGTATPTITTLIGEAGYGKTHLAQMLVQHLEVLPKIQTIFIRAKEVLGGGAGQTAREIFIRALSLPEVAPPDLGRSLLVGALGPEMAKEVWAGVVVAMGWAPPEHPDLGTLAAAPGALRSGAARAAGEALRIMSRSRPLAVIIEDAHFVDETALDALEFATLKEADCPIWICVVGRPSFGRGRSAWAGRAAHRQDLSLPALEPGPAAELVRRLLSPAENVPASALARLADRTQGIPLLMVELVRGLKRDGLVRKSEKTNAWYLSTDELDKLPDLPLVQWLASRETESLPPDLLAHARLASVLGFEFSTEELEGVMEELERAGSPPETQLDASIGVSRLSETGILVRHRGGRVGFRHSLLRDSVYQGVPAAQREVSHRAAFDHFKRQDRLPETGRLPQMAFHAARSGLKEEAGRIYLDLAKRMLARHAYLDAETLFRNALENLPDSEDLGLITAARGRSLMRFRLGRHEDASKDLDLALARARKVKARTAEIDILLDQGIVLDWTNDYKHSAAVTAEAEALLKDAEQVPILHARLLMGLGRSAYRADRLPEAAEFLAKAVTASESLGDDGYETLTQSMMMLCFSLTNFGKFDEATAVSDRCIAVAEEHNDRLLLAQILQNRGLLYFMLGKTEELVADFRRCIQTAREYGFPMSESLAVKDLGEVFFYLGRPDDAEPCAYRAAELYAMTLGDKSPRVAYSLVLLARARAYRGDVEGAREVVERITQKQEEIKAEGVGDTALPPDGKALLDGVSLWLKGASDGEFDALLAHARAFPLQPQDVVEIMEFKALSALRTGRRAEGIRFLEEAYADADKNAKVVQDRLRRQLDHVMALAS
jgi:eukaryotic-like serine/threonine-protein kinase